MSIDRSLRMKSSLARHRNVLTRAERVAKLMKDEKWSDAMSPMGMAKLGHRKVKAGKKPKKEAAAEGTEAAAAGTPAAGAAAAPAKAEKDKK
ncbi:MAG: small basic protein [Planctomycetes bacterium]|nr:small basic protein [Planctomycetota bacterium]